jgi:hypothetical protein
VSREVQALQRLYVVVLPRPFSSAEANFSPSSRSQVVVEVDVLRELQVLMPCLRICADLLRVSDPVAGDARSFSPLDAEPASFLTLAILHSPTSNSEFSSSSLSFS